MFLITMEAIERRGAVWWDGSGWCAQQYHAKEFKRVTAAKAEIAAKIHIAARIVRVARKDTLPVNVPTVKNGQAGDISPWHAGEKNPAEPAAETGSTGRSGEPS